MTTTALPKKIALSGLCSRRQAVKLVQSGRVSVDGDIAQTTIWVNDDCRITVDGMALPDVVPKVYIAYHKPVGVNCNCVADRADSIVNFIDVPEQVMPVGRLDKDSLGLLLLTNDGALHHRLMHPAFAHVKRYEVQVDRAFPDEFLVKMSEPVAILETLTLPCKVRRLSDDRFEIHLTQGLNRQIRRMAKANGFRVIYLKRVAINAFDLGDLLLGQWRYLNESELSLLGSSGVNPANGA